MPFSARSWLVVTDKKSPERIFTIGDSRQPEATVRSARPANCGVCATPENVKTCRRSVADVTQLPRSKRRLVGSLHPASRFGLWAVSVQRSVMQCDHV